MSDYKITDLAVPSPDFDRSNPGESNVTRGGGVVILTQEQEDQKARDVINKANVHKRNMETYAAMIANPSETAKRKA